MDNSLITMLEEFIDNIKINEITTASRCSNKVTRLPTSVPAKLPANNSSSDTKKTGRQNQGRTPRIHLIDELTMERKYSNISRNTRRSSNIDSFKEPDRRSSEKFVYRCKIPTRIRRSSLSVQDTHKVIDKMLKNVEITIDVSGKNERKTLSLKKMEEHLNKTYITSQRSMIMNEKCNLAPSVLTNISPASCRPLDDLYISNRTGLEASATNSERTPSHKIRKSTQGKLLRKNITMKNDPNYAVDVIDYDSKSAITSSYTDEEYLIGSYNGEGKLYSNNEEYAKKFVTTNNGKTPISTQDNHFKMLNCGKNETTRLKNLHRRKKFEKLESTHIERLEENEGFRSSQSRADEKKISDEKTSVLGLEKYTITYESSFCDDLPDVGTYEEFVAGRREKFDVDNNKRNTLPQEIVVGAYEDFERDLKNYDHRRLRGLECSMFKSGNIVMTEISINILRF